MIVIVIIIILFRFARNQYDRYRGDHQFGHLSLPTQRPALPITQQLSSVEGEFLSGAQKVIHLSPIALVADRLSLVAFQGCTDIKRFDHIVVWVFPNPKCYRMKQEKAGWL